MKDVIPFLGKRSTRDAVDDVFSRDVLGSILLGLAVGKTVEHVVKFMIGTEAFPLFARFVVAYSVASAGFLVVFVYWEEIETATKEKLDDVTETDLGTGTGTNADAGQDSGK